MANAGGNNKDILIRVRADLARALKDLQGLESQLEDTGEAGKQAGDGLSRTEKSVQFLTRAAGAYLSLQFAKRVFLQADAMQALSTRVRTATKDTGDHERAWSDTLDTAIDTGAAFDVIVGLFQNIDRAAPELEATTNEVLRLTEAVAQLGVISGASDAAQRAGLTQFSQMLSGQVARAEEFNSLLENVPEVANRIAHGMNMTVGELRAAVLEGNVLSRDVFESLLGQTDEIAREFAQIPPTFERSWSAAVTAASAQIKRLDDALNTTSGWANILQQLAIVMTPDSAETQLGKRAGELFREQERLKQLVDYMERQPEAESPIERFLNAKNLERARSELERVNDALEQLRQKSREMAGTEQPSAGNNEPAVDPEVVQAIVELTQKFQDQTATLGATNEQVAAYRTSIGDLKGATDEQKQALIEAARALDEKTAAQKAAQDAEKLAAADQQHITALENEIKLIGMNERAQAQFAAVQKLSTAATDEQRQAVMELAGALYDLEQRVPVKRFAALENEYRKITDLLSQNVQRVQAEVDAGLRSELSGRQEIIRLQREAAATLESGVLPRLQELARVVGPEAEAGVRDVANAIRQLRDHADPIFAEIRTGAESAFSGFVQDALRNIDNLSDAFEALGDSILDTMYRVIGDRAAQMFVDFLFQAFGPQAAPGSGAGNSATVSAGVNHSGGIAGIADAGRRKVSPALFNHAPRFHTGGIVGDEVPIIARRREGVFTPAQMKALAPVGSGATEVHIHAPPGYQARTESSRDGNGRQRLDVMFDEIAAGSVRRGGQLAKAIEQKYGLSPQGR
jgi:tape measure domain-containing protein